VANGVDGSVDATGVDDGIGIGPFPLGPMMTATMIPTTRTRPTAVSVPTRTLRRVGHLRLSIDMIGYKWKGSVVKRQPTVLGPLAVCLLTVISLLMSNPQTWVRWAAWSIGMVACGVLVFVAFHPPWPVDDEAPPTDAAL
jgi:hypothetical protein